MPSRSILPLLLAVVLLSVGAAWAGEPSAEELPTQFASPPDSARPWVYWFWKNGNISREGITADLEAMQRVGIRGVIFMEVALNTPRGPVPFFSPRWRELFQHAVREADRLGLQIEANSAPGWTGSGGAWVTPEQSMQKVVARAVQVSGPRHFEEQLPQPEAVCDFYRDIAVLAYPTPAEAAPLPDVAEKALYQRGPYSSMPGVKPALPMPAEYPVVPEAQRIARESIVSLSSQMDATGRLVWDVPEGAWTIVRFGHTSTGQTNRPAPSVGLECDKLDRQALESHFRQFTAELLRDAGPDGRRALVATHLDSWEVGAQNWSRQFRGEFQRRRGYDPIPYLPVMMGQIVESREISERFLWDLRTTVSELIVENHGRYMRELANQAGLWFSVEPYDMTPCDDMSLGSTADVPMCEFWTNTFDSRYSVKEATSVAHVYGRPLVAAEAFTSTESWLFHPGGMKPTGDWAFCEGVNRFVIHRYVHQPFAQIRPGLSLGPHGIHYERTQTWWEWTGPWHDYLARCQYLLQQGRWVADVLYLNPEGAPNVFQSPGSLGGYKLDACTPEALRTRVQVQDGRLVLPDGMSYRMLVLPELETMTPELLGRVAELVEQGATVVGTPPRKSPSLVGYPACDRAVAALAERLWGPRPATATRVERSVGRGHLVWQVRGEQDRAASRTQRAVTAAHWIWGGTADAARAAPVGKRYFRRIVELPERRAVSAQMLLSADNAFSVWVNGHQSGTGGDFTRLNTMDLTFRLRPGRNLLAVQVENQGQQPNPAGLLGTLVVRYADGEELVVPTDAQWETADEVPSGWTRNPQLPAAWTAAVDLGPWGMAPWGPVAEPEQPRVYPATELVCELLGRQTQPDFVGPSPLDYAHRQIGEWDAYFVSNLGETVVEAPCQFRVVGKSPELWHPESGQVWRLPQFTVEAEQTTVPLRLEAGESYFVVFRPDQHRPSTEAQAGENFASRKTVAQLAGPWTVTFAPADGGPEQPVVFDELVDWTERPEEEIKYYSGTARYQQRFSMASTQPEKGRRYSLDLGRVAVMARGTLNGRDLGIAWKAPFRWDVTEALQPGENRLEIQVVNLWPNRMIGDERLPLDCELRPDRALVRWPDWLLEGKPSPTGRHTFASWREWTADSPLLESGLLGPVTVLVEE